MENGISTINKEQELSISELKEMIRKEQGNFAINITFEEQDNGEQ